MIPSPKTFFESINWLEPCAKTIRSFLPTNRKKSTRQSTFRRYTGDNQTEGIVRGQEKNVTFSHRLGSKLESTEYRYR